MDKKPKRGDIPKPKEDVKIEKGDAKFKSVLSNFVKKTTNKPKEKPE